MDLVKTLKLTNIHDILHTETVINVLLNTNVLNNTWEFYNSNWV